MNKVLCTYFPLPLRTKQVKSAGLDEELVQCVTSISDEWRSDLLVTVPQKLRKTKAAAKRSIIHTKNRVCWWKPFENCQVIL